MHALLAALGDPQESFEAIHVVGTNGKSTTATMIEALLLAHELEVGSYLSPHVERWSERIRVRGREADFEQALARVRLAAEATAATQFEALTAAALAEFDAADVKVAVVEAGLGGRLDATNVLRTMTVVLTNVGLDHVEQLGSTRAEIAGEKLAVVREGSSVVLGEAEWRELATANGAGKVVVEAGGSLALAVAAAELYLGADVDPAPAQAVALPGRLEVRGSAPLEIWDGAHNPEGVRYLLSQLPDRRDFVLVASILSDKNCEAMLELYAQRASRLIATTSGNPRALPAHELARRAQRYFPEVETVADASEALRRSRLVAGPTGAVLVSGSLYLLAELAAVRSSGLPWEKSANE
jgi:dihydrofolate synthase/folylpolyglutamate synthase